MLWIQKIWMHLAARHYATRLPPMLRAEWGKSVYYTSGQVETLLNRLGGDKTYAVIAFAALLTKDDFDRQDIKTRGLNYGEARSLYRRYSNGSNAYAFESTTDDQARSRGWFD